MVTEDEILGELSNQVEAVAQSIGLINECDKAVNVIVIATFSCTETGRERPRIMPLQNSRITDTYGLVESAARVLGRIAETSFTE